MSPTRLQLKGASLEELRTQVLAEYGPAARIVAAEKVTVGGIRGYLARHHYEVTVEIPDPPAPGTVIEGRPDSAAGPGRRAAHALDEPRRAGIAALLAEAEALEAQLHGRPPELNVSTSSGGFAELMDDLTFNAGRTSIALPGTGSGAAGSGVAVPDTAGPGTVVSAVSRQPAPAGPGTDAAGVAPVPLAGAGDLVVVAGLGEDPLHVARSMAAVVRGQGQAGEQGAILVPPEVKAGGALAGTVRRPVQDRKSALAARARGVEHGHSVFVAFGLGRGGPDLDSWLPVLAGLEADQLWVAVDAGRKPGDTARWVHRIMRVAEVDAVAVEGSAATDTPQTVLELGLPIGWIDGDRP
ncbi:hypothetical protein LVY72_07045 [Arthrobacter sp. I2-34]|uniref:Uncharacterized protein n=1 Tax=Arthrobacter hankyongi TaxID=2904801 RepID=A0ABS9L4T2_9MICC|nr:hypothetical protein [Arthrobacter hankyongi]MCG2621671.1 hypothetical protein [Arthrobacter hankyongi]